MWRTFVFMPAEPASSSAVSAKIEELRVLNKRKKKAYTVNEFFTKVLIPLVEEEHDECEEPEWIDFKDKFTSIEYNVDEEKQVYTLETTAKYLKSFLKNITDEEWETIKRLERGRRNKTNVEHRMWDLGYYQAKDIIKTLDESEKQQKYDEAKDDKTKNKVFGSLTHCFLSGDPVNGVGDHICPMRGNRWKTCCLGSNTAWNLAPVKSALNQPYKNIVVFVGGTFQKVCLDNTTFDWEYDVIDSSIILGNNTLTVEALLDDRSSIQIKNEARALTILEWAKTHQCQVIIQKKEDDDGDGDGGGYSESKDEADLKFFEKHHYTNMFEIEKIESTDDLITIKFNSLWSYEKDEIKEGDTIILWSPWNEWSTRFAEILYVANESFDNLYNIMYNYIHSTLAANDMTYSFKTIMKKFGMEEKEGCAKRIRFKSKETTDAIIVRDIDNFGQILMREAGAEREVDMDKVLKMPNISQWYTDNKPTSVDFFKKNYKDLKKLLGDDKVTLGEFRAYFTKVEGDTNLRAKRNTFWKTVGLLNEYKVYEYMRESGARDIYKWMKDKYDHFTDNIQMPGAASSLKMRKHDAIDIFMKLEIWQAYVKKRGAHMEWAIDPDKLDALEKILIDRVKDISDKTKEYMDGNYDKILRSGDIITIPLGGAGT
jgi:hypothetical protein